MKYQYSNLSDVINTLCKDKNMHICIHDIAGISGADFLKIDPMQKTHTSQFCDAAKSTERGFKLCIRCKTLANKKAAFGQAAFCGHCPYGLFEYVQPVIFKGNTVCIIYVGNMVLNRETTLKKLRFTADLTGINPELLMKELENAHYDNDVSLSKSIAELLSSYIRLLLNSSDVMLPPVRLSGCKNTIKDIVDYVHLNYSKDISLKQLAGLYFINEKYLGNLFWKETGTTFRSYLNDLRLDHSVAELKNTDKSILHIAMDSGFKNVTYFNRQFKKKFGMSPTAFRKNNAF